MPILNGITVYLEINGIAVGAIDNAIQTINANSTIETVAGVTQVVAAVTGPIPGLGLMTNTVALTMAGVTADPNGATLGQAISAVGNAVGIVAGAFAIAGVAVPALTVVGVVLTVGGAAYNFYDMYQKNRPSTIDPNTNTAFTAARNWTPPRDPLVLDLDGDGIEAVGINPNAPILFDHDGDGTKNATGWIKADDGIVVMDRNGNDLIDSGRELFGDNTVLARGPKAGQTAANGFEALADLDLNGDGALNSADATYAQPHIWQDTNQDGVSQAAELKTLAAMGIASINVTVTPSNVSLGNGNTEPFSGSFNRTNGPTGMSGVAAVTGSLLLALNNLYRKLTDDPVVSSHSCNIFRRKNLAGVCAISADGYKKCRIRRRISNRTGRPRTPSAIFVKPGRV